MATTYVSKAKASFRTAYLQREKTIVLAAKDTVTGHIGEVYKINTDGEFERVGATSSTSAAAAKAACIAAVQEGQYILAQSDMTVGYGHVPVEDRDYRYSDAVAMEDSTERKFVVYEIKDLDDVLIETDDSSTEA